MALIIVDYMYDPAQKEGMDKFRSEHRGFLSSLARAGVVKAAGPAPLGEGNPLAVILCEAASPQDALEALSKDPFLLRGYIKSRRARAWTVAVGEV